MARLTSRQLWTAKLAGKTLPGGAAPAKRGVSGATLPFVKRPYIGLVLGIDPSLRGTGLALVDFQAGRPPVLLRCRTVRVPGGRPMAFALAQIHRAVREFIEGSPAVRHVALERTIYVQNFQTAQILGAARGAAIAAAALGELPVFEYAPLRVKQAVAGSGRASKEQLARTVKSLLGHARSLAFDEADAAGVALCHAFTWQP
ncbi:MAG: crossover junction endodeoxyribonuclease RuvC [Opitutaceae bacterium]|jgi:crossover junction endodeoxyribonuclease RuvC